MGAVGDQSVRIQSRVAPVTERLSQARRGEFLANTGLDLPLAECMPIRLAHKVQCHQDLVVVMPALLQRVLLDAVFDKAETGVEPAGPVVVADDGELDQLDMLTRIVDDGFDELPPNPGISRIRLHIHAPEQALVLFLLAVAPHKSRRPNQLQYPQGPKNRTPA